MKQETNPMTNPVKFETRQSTVDIHNMILTGLLLSLTILFSTVLTGCGRSQLSTDVSNSICNARYQTSNNSIPNVDCSK
jgi:hypothetical protein